MSDALINWFVVNLGGKVGKELIHFYHLDGSDPGTAWRAACSRTDISEYPDVACDSGQYYRKSAADSFYSASDHKDFLTG